MAMYLSGANLRQIFFFLLGSFDGATWAPAGRRRSRSSWSGTAAILLRARSLDGLLLGDEAAAHLGVDVAARARDPARPRVARHRGRGDDRRAHRVRRARRAARRPAGRRARTRGRSCRSRRSSARACSSFADLGARILGEIPVGVVTALVRRPVLPVPAAPDPKRATSCDRRPGRGRRGVPPVGRSDGADRRVRRRLGRVPLATSWCTT